jgi:cytosine/adenosine deaminase-related metal-dependent hydrolase
MGMMHASSIPSMETREKIQSLRQFESRGLLGSNLKLAHMVHVDDSELDLLKRHQVKVSHCPTAAMKHCKGLSKFGRFPEMLEKGVCVSLGADSANGSDHIDMLRIMNTVACIFKDSRMTAAVMPAETVLEMATIRGAEALMLEDEIGSIEPGKKADLVLFDRNHPEWRPLLNVANSLVYSASACSIDAVFVDGIAVVENGRTRNVDENEIYRNADELAPRLLKRANLPMPSKWPVV